MNTVYSEDSYSYKRQAEYEKFAKERDEHVARIKSEEKVCPTCNQVIE